MKSSVFSDLKKKEYIFIKIREGVNQSSFETLVIKESGGISL